MIEKNVHLRKLTAEEIESIYKNHLVKDFPAGEVKPLKVILERFHNGQYLGYGLFLNREPEELAGYAFIMNIRTDAIYLLDYFAIVEGMRISGYGSVFLNAIKETCVQENRRLILEVENPDYEKDIRLQEKMQKRIAFYKKNDIHVSGVTCNFYDNEYRILYAGTTLEDQQVYQKIMLSYVDFFGEEFIEAHVVFH